MGQRQGKAVREIKPEQRDEQELRNRKPPEAADIAEGRELMVTALEILE